MKLTSAEDKLIERTKELNCIHEISKIISQTDHVANDVLLQIASHIKKAWLFDQDAIVEIDVLDYHITTSEINCCTIFQTSKIPIAKMEAGYVKVHYPKNKFSKKDFLHDEQKLLDTIAFEIGNFIEKYQTLERKALLRRTVERMDRLTLLGEMTAGIAHELNTPLGNILGFAELIKDHNSDPVIAEDISTVINSVIYSREIVKKLMFFSCEMPQQLQIQEIKPIITFALSFLKSNFQKKEIKTAVSYSDECITAKIDSVQITQVLFNLLINAVYASPEKSIIRIEVQKQADKALISIIDEGIGIPENIKQKIFDPFFTTKPNTDGCGLGLSVVHGIVKNHNGQIIVENNNPSGTIFTIKLPIS
ncbi:sensor histidine kinase [Flavobacterium foetidum]|uniref:sensor histidine kinase n=1 Tax=Flavobacterium foetidum TaxID=2026681 RepID=UPI00107584F5|nr:ATP-binding protein [Flavobacterium foetidum]KAF2515578.1 GHKL domain-containing protein [Flavobacterium foetidum]